MVWSGRGAPLGARAPVPREQRRGEARPQERERRGLGVRLADEQPAEHAGTGWEDGSGDGFSLMCLHGVSTANQVGAQPFTSRPARVCLPVCWCTREQTHPRSIPRGARSRRRRPCGTPSWSNQSGRRDRRCAHDLVSRDPDWNGLHRAGLTEYSTPYEFE